jgi:hypothetical protein
MKIILKKFIFIDFRLLLFFRYTFHTLFWGHLLIKMYDASCLTAVVNIVGLVVCVYSSTVISNVCSLWVKLGAALLCFLPAPKTMLFLVVEISNIQFNMQLLWHGKPSKDYKKVNFPLRIYTHAYIL